MAFNYMENISYNNNKPNFERDSVKTLAQLLAVEPANKNYDYGHIVFCEEDGRHYRFNYDYDNLPADNEKDTVTGWFLPIDGTRKALKDDSGNILSKGYVLLQRNKDFTSQVSAENAIYEIRYNFDLGGASITLPAGSVLKFEGGMLSNGTIVGNNVTLVAPLVKIFDETLNFSGDFNCDFYPEWWGAASEINDTIDNSAVFNRAIECIEDMNGTHNLVLTTHYVLKDTIYLRRFSSLIGNHNTGTFLHATPRNDKKGCGFIANFNNNNSYVIDSIENTFTIKSLNNFSEKFKDVTNVEGTFNTWVGCSLEQDLRRSGLIKNIKFSASLSVDYTFQARISKKVRNKENKITGCTTVIDGLSFTLKAGETDIDVSNLNIYFDWDYVFEIYLEDITGDFVGAVKYAKDKADGVNYVRYNNQVATTGDLISIEIETHVPYNLMWVNEENNEYRKHTNIKNISIQPLQKSDGSYNAPVFGGIRLHRSFFGKIENVDISGVAVGISVHCSWGYEFSSIIMHACLCGFYFGKFNTIQKISTCCFEANWWGGSYTWDTTNLVWKNKSILYPPFDGEGRRPTDEGYTSPITIKSVGIISESYPTDYNKIMVDNSIFQGVNCVLLSNWGHHSFNFCYWEGVKFGLYTYSGAIKWLNPSHRGTNLFPYTVATIDGTVTIEGANDVRCYPHYTMDDLKLCKTSVHYKVSSMNNYLDKFSITTAEKENEMPPSTASKGTVNAGGIAAAKQLVATDNTYYVGWKSWRDFTYDYAEIASGLTKTAPSTFANIISRYNPDRAIIYNTVFGTDFSAADSSGNVPLLSDKKFSIIKTQEVSSDNSAVANGEFPLLNPMRLYNSEIYIDRFQLRSNPGDNIDGKIAPTLDYLFEVSGKCKIKCTGYAHSNIIPNKLVKLSAGNHDELVELDINLTDGWGIYADFDRWFDNPDNVKYNIRFRTAQTGSYKTLTNTVPPSKGLKVGEIWYYVETTTLAEDEATLSFGNMLFMWNGSVWDVIKQTGDSVIATSAVWVGNDFVLSYIGPSGNTLTAVLYTK